MSPPKAAPPTFTQRHAETIAKLKLVLIVVCLVAIPVSFLLNHQEVGSVNSRITRIESPCQRYGSESKVCQEAFETAVHSITHRIACYIDHESGKPFKPSCVGVRLRIDLRPRSHAPAPGGNGGDASDARPGSSQPGRHEGGPGSREVASGGGGHKGSPEKLTPPPKAPGEPGGGAEAVGAPAAPSSPGTPSPSTTERITETTVEHAAPEAPVRSGLTEVVGGVGQVVEEPGATVNAVVGGVTETTCSLAKVLCH